MTSTKVKLLGERNTATNALKRLIERNSASSVLPCTVTDLKIPLRPVFSFYRRHESSVVRKEKSIDLAFALTSPLHCWKHAAANFGPNDLALFRGIPIVITVRNPASWLLAFHRNPYHALQPVPKSFNEFLVTPWQTLGRDRLQSCRLNPPALYNKKISSYLNFETAIEQIGGVLRFVRFEDFVANQVQVFDDLRSLVSAPVEHAQVVLESTKDPQKTVTDYANYYGKELWRKELDENSVMLINDEIDWNLVGRFQYKSL